MPLFLSQPTCKSSANPLGVTMSRIQPRLPTFTVVALLLSVLDTAVRMTQLMSLPVQNTLVPSCLTRRVPFSVVASHIQIRPSVLDLTLLGLGP